MIKSKGAKEFDMPVLDKAAETYLILWLASRMSVDLIALNSKEPEMRHDPVMVSEILEVLPLEEGSIVVDGTIGLGGHSDQFLQKIGAAGTLVGIDWDDAMLAEARQRLEGRTKAKMHFIRDDYASISRIMGDLGLKADGILLDLGLNLAQLEDSSRGISFSNEGPLDMRMDRSRGEPASALLNRLSLGEIEQMIFDLGDERWAKAIAKEIVKRRKDQPLRTTEDLVQCVLAAIPAGARDKRIHPATRTFQAVRIAVNKELEILEKALGRAAASLAPHGVLAVLSYHSGEDRIVKQAFKALVKDGEYEELFKKPFVPSSEEILINPRSRSAKLRAIRRK